MIGLLSDQLRKLQGNYASIRGRTVSIQKTDVVVSLLKNSSLSSEKLDEISKVKKTPTFLCALASNPSISKNLRDKFINHKNEDVKCAFTRNPALTDDDFNILIEDEDVDCALSSSKLTLPKKVLDQLVNSPSEYLRQNLTWRSDLSEDHFLALSQDEDEDIIKNLAENKHIPMKILASLINHDNSKIKEVAIREYIKRQSHNDDLLLKLAKEELKKPVSEADSKLTAIAHYAHNLSKELLEVLIKTNVEPARRWLIYNLKTPIETLEYLAKNDPSENIKNLASSRLRWIKEIQPKLPEYIKTLRDKFGIGTYLPDLNESHCIGGFKSETGTPTLTFIRKLENGSKFELPIDGTPKSLRFDF